MQRSAVCVRPFDDGGHVLDRHAAHGMQCGADEYVLSRRSTCWCSASTRSAQRVAAAVAEPLLWTVVQGCAVGTPN